MKPVCTVMIKLEKSYDGTVICTLMDGDEELISYTANKLNAKDLGCPIKELYLQGECYQMDASTWLRRRKESEEALRHMELTIPLRRAA